MKLKLANVIDPDSGQHGYCVTDEDGRIVENLSRIDFAATKDDLVLSARIVFRLDQIDLTIDRNGIDSAVVEQPSQYTLGYDSPFIGSETGDTLPLPDVLVLQSTPGTHLSGTTLRVSDTHGRTLPHIAGISLSACLDKEPTVSLVVAGIKAANE